MTCCMSPCPIWKCDLKTTTCYKDNAIDQKCGDNPPIHDHNQRMAQGEGIVYARDDAFNDGAPRTWMRTGNAQVARMGGVARMGRARAPRATQNSRYEGNCYKGRRKDASRATCWTSIGLSTPNLEITRQKCHSIGAHTLRLEFPSTAYSQRPVRASPESLHSEGRGFKLFHGKGSSFYS